MPVHLLLRSAGILFFILGWFAVPIAQAQGARQSTPQEQIRDADADHVKERNEWFFRGRLLPGRSSAELRRRAYNAKMQARAQRAAVPAVPNAQIVFTGGSWIPLGPAPLASDASGNGTQDYHQVAGRATAVAIDPADPTGNTIYVGGAQSGIWKSTNAANPDPSTVTWTPLTDNQATLSIGAIAIQPGGSDSAKTVILAATGEANNSGDSYFGLGILRSTDAGGTWSLIPTANNGALSFSGLGGTRMAFGAANTVVSAMATTSEGLVDGEVTPATMRGLYSSLDAGLSWTYNALVDPGGPTDPTSATSVIYNPSAGKFFAAVRYHGFYSSPDGIHWTRLAAQPGGSTLSVTACPPQSTINDHSCPIYRAELTALTGRNEMYAWFVSSAPTGATVDGGIWQSLNGGLSWSSISDSSIINCGDFAGCGVEQGSYNLELLAVPSLTGTDLYAGAVNLFKCSITSHNPSCAVNGFMNLTHVYGCVPIAAPAHVHPDQHALAFMIPTAGTDSGNALMYFANDGGVYRALDGFSGLNTGSCTGMNLFDDLNQRLGSMTQFVSFSQHPTDPNTLLGGTQDNGSPATNHATTSPAWGNVLGGDGGYNAIDPAATSNFYASNPDVPPGGLGVQLCPDGVACFNGAFDFVVTSDALAGDDGDFYFPFVLDPQSSSALLIGTCRVWRGPRVGGAYIPLSPNFDTLTSATCSGREVNLVRAIATGGPTDSNGSKVVYATTSGYGPIDGPLSLPTGGHVWVTTNATLGSPGFSDVTNNGPQGNINPNQFPISSVALDASDTTDATGATAYVTLMGFTGAKGHVWKTTNFGGSWTDFTGNLPDSPVNTAIVDTSSSVIYVGTDVGVFASSTLSPNWSELGPTSGQTGFLPNVAVTALGLFNAGGQELLRASTYGRGIWQYTLVAKPDYQIAISNSAQTTFSGQTALFSGTADAQDGYASSVALSCVAGTTAAPTTCAASPATVTPGASTPFSVIAGGADGDYNFNVQGLGSDAKHIKHLIPVTLHVISFGLTAPSPASVTAPRGTTSPAVKFQATAAGSFSQAVNVSCTLTLANATCSLLPSSTVYPTSGNPVNMSAAVTVPPGATAGNYTATIQASVAGGLAAVTTTFILKVTSNPDFVLSEPSAFPEVNAGSTGATGPITIAAQDGFTGTVALTCANTFGSGSCSVSPNAVSSFPATATLTINGTSFASGSYSIAITGTAGTVTHSLSVPFNVGDYSISGTQTISLAPGGQANANLTLTSAHFYVGRINATCDPSAMPGAQCLLSPANPITLAAGGTASLVATINVPKDAASGTYNIRLASQDTAGNPSHEFRVAITVGQDFLLTSSTASQSVHAGQTTGAYALTVQPVGSSFNAAVTLACTGLPSLTRCQFNPSTPVTPDNSAVNVVMTISTTAPSSAAHWQSLRGSIFYAFLLLPAVVGGCAMRRPTERNTPVLLFLGMLLALLITLPACSGVSSGSPGGGGGNPGTPAGTYKITVTGTSPGAPSDAGQSDQVTLVVN